MMSLAFGCSVEKVPKVLVQISSFNFDIYFMADMYLHMLLKEHEKVVPHWDW